ncbi:unannotated protein [freshwater metagenome]|uniref:Unannotated protein n=1 Tax=freshwater metagenome TaxID=449393 RepID=A0A6J7HYM9_9ZZZZ
MHHGRIDGRGHRPHCGGGKQHRQRNSRTEASDNPRGAERVAAELEEGVVAPYVCSAQDICEHAGDRAFRVGLRRDVVGMKGLRGKRKCTTIDFAARGHGQRVESHDVMGHHPRRQMCLEVRSQPHLIESHGGSGDIQGKSVFTQERYRGAYSWENRCDGVDLTEFESPSVQLNLSISAAEVFERRSVDGPSDDVSGSVEARPRYACVGDEPRRCQTGLAVITAGELIATEIQLADAAVRCGPQMRIEHQCSDAR